MRRSEGSRPPMNRSIEIAVTAVGGLCLFVVAFLGFAKMSGVPMSKVAVLGQLFEAATSKEPENVAPEVSVDPPRATSKQVIEASLGVLDAYAFEPPYSAEELHSLALDLKAAKLQYEERLRSVAAREVDVLGREELLGHQLETLEELRAELDRYEATLALRTAELLRDQGASTGDSPAQWAEIARIFEGGPADIMKDRLLEFGAEDAAKILGELDVEQAAKLLNALPAERWKEYVDAYSRVAKAE